MGFHRYFTHGSFKANRAFKIALGVAGSLAIEGPILNWVSDHRRHHKYSDKEGDPHSPWRFGTDLKALTKGLVWAHMGWLFDRKVTSHKKFSPDWLADKDIRRVNRLFPVLVAVTLVAPAVIVGLWTMSWQGAVIAFFWAGLVRVSFLHHVTWSINSICHTFGKREFEAQGQVQERRLAGRALVRRVVAQPAPRRPDLRPARRLQGADRHRRPRHLAGRETGLGLEREVARRRPADRQEGGRSVRELGSMTKRGAANPIG